jgi:hypothetical protein
LAKDSRFTPAAQRAPLLLDVPPYLPTPRASAEEAACDILQCLPYDAVGRSEGVAFFLFSRDHAYLSAVSMANRLNLDWRSSAW